MSGSPSPGSGAAPIVVVGIDLHKGSTLTMNRALAQAAAMGADVHLLCVNEPNIANVKPPDDLDASDITGTDLHRLQEFVDQRLADFARKRPTVKVPKVEMHHDTGDPADKLVELAAELDADIVILGTHGRTGLKRLLIGSVAEKVVRHAGCQVLVVREKKHERAEE